MADYVAGKAWKQEKYLRILEAGFTLFAEKGIENVTMSEIADMSGVGRATAFRYFSSKTELVIAVSAWKWKEYIDMYAARFTPEITESLCGAQCLRLFIVSFLDLYRNHRELLRFNYLFNSFLHYSPGTEEQRQTYRRVADSIGTEFHKLYERGAQDGTLNTDIPEQTMFSSTFHIMLAAVTRYAMGLAVVYENDPENELVMLVEMLMSRFTKNTDIDQRFGFDDKEEYYVR